MAIESSSSPRTDNTGAETASSTARARYGLDANWTRIEGVAGAGTLLASFVWFLGAPAGPAVGVGFGTVLLLDFVRQLIFGSSGRRQSGLDAPEVARQ